LLVVRFEELPDLVGIVEQPHPLLFIERHGKSPEAIKGEAALSLTFSRS
jgi:hypothetical protein